jgi:hypothetical protein
VCQYPDRRLWFVSLPKSAQSGFESLSQGFGHKSLSIFVCFAPNLLNARDPDSPTSTRFARLVYRLRLSNPCRARMAKATNMFMFVACHTLTVTSTGILPLSKSSCGGQHSISRCWVKTHLGKKFCGISDLHRRHGKP